jgi:hypothetical protein
MSKRTKTESLINELVKSENAIREKYKKIKLAKSDAADFLSDSLRPITEPLNTLVESSKALKLKSELLQDSMTDQKFTGKEENDTSMEYEESTNEEEEEEDDDMESELEEEEEENTESSGEHKPLTEKESSYEKNAAKFGQLAKKYFLMHFEGNNAELDKTYGIYSDGNRWYLGDSQIQISKDSIFLKDEVYKGTEGLFQLLFLKEPNSNTYSEDDLDKYQRMLLETNAYKQNYDASKQINSNRGIKYINIIRELVSKTGTGIDLNSVRYEYWDDPNELVDRLRLLVASNQAGNNSVNNEIFSIIEELRECNIIE